MAKPFLSILIVNWNGHEHLKTCLESIYTQNYNDFEVILVDNDSKDDSLEFVKSTFPQVKCVELDENTGFAKGNNIGLKYCNGENIFLLNNDTELETNCLEEIFNSLNTYSDYDFFSLKMVMFYEREILDNAGVEMDIFGIIAERGRGEQATMYREDKPCFAACAGAAIYRKDILTETGFLDEDFFLIYEDIDLSFRLQLLGHRCMYLSNPVVYHKLRSSIVSENSVYYSQRNIESLLLKNMFWLWYIFISPIRFIYLFGSFFHFYRQGNSKVFLKAKKDFLKKIPESLTLNYDLYRKVKFKKLVHVIFLLRTPLLLNKIKKIISPIL